jgi:acetolactate synthase-1/2/3 large subunit
MNLGELETVTTYDLPVKVVVMNNHGDGMVRQWQKLFFKGRFSASDKSLHKGLHQGCRSRRLPTGAASTSRRRAKSSPSCRIQGPAFLEVVIVRMPACPMVGPGMSYAQMITGDWIPSREQVEARREVDKSEMF